MNNIPLFTTAYFPPVHYIARLAQHPIVYIEQHDHYTKQTYRNRCNILAANGPIALTVPVAKGRRPKVPTKDIKVDYATHWQANHYRSVMSAYKSSPFYEFYIDEFIPVFEQKFDYLIDLNQFILHKLIDCFGLDTRLELTTLFQDSNELDFRDRIHPKKTYAETDPCFTAIPYWQVFWNRFDFSPNMSSLDILFNMGPEAEELLLKMVDQERG